jgi:hypothetical protein
MVGEEVRGASNAVVAKGSYIRRKRVSAQGVFFLREKNVHTIPVTGSRIGRRELDWNAGWRETTVGTDI